MRVARWLCVAHFAFREAAAAPAAMLLNLAAASATLVLPMLQFQRFSEDGRLPRDCALATLFLFGLALCLGGAGRIHGTLRSGTAALAFVKPIGRGTWLWAQWLGTLLGLGLFCCTQAPAILLAEACSPRYHTTGAFADVPTLLLAQGALAAALVLAALGNRFWAARFAWTANGLLPLLLWGLLLVRLPAGSIHWGTLTALPALLMFLAQAAALAAALAVAVGPGLTAAITVGAVLCCQVFLGASAYLPFDALSSAGPGAVPLRALLMLVPQSLCVAWLCLLGGTMRLEKEVL